MGSNTDRMLALRRTEAYAVYQRPRYPPERATRLESSYARNLTLIADAKQRSKFRSQPFVTRGEVGLCERESLERILRSSPTSRDYQSNFAPKRMIVGPMMLTGRRYVDPPPQLMFWAASELVRL